MRHMSVALEALTDLQTRLIIERSIHWLVNAQEPNGHFNYEYLPYEDIYSDDDNIVRQAGALYALGEVAKRDTRNNHEQLLRPAISRSIAYFESISKAATYNGRVFRAVCTNPAKRKYKLGATSLVLCGILATTERYPDFAETYSDLIKDYKEFIVAMKKDEAGFIAGFKLYRKAQKPQNPKESSYSNGEALLALTRYHRFAKTHALPEQDKASERITKDMFSYIDSIAVPFDSSLYLWAMAAIKDLTTYDAEQGSTHLDYMNRYTHWRIKSVQNKKTSKHNFASAVEGMASAYFLLQSAPGYKETAQKIASEIDFWLAHTAQMQLVADDNPKADGGFLTGLSEPTQRIDFTQHALMAYIQKLSDIDGQSL